MDPRYASQPHRVTVAATRPIEFVLQAPPNCRPSHRNITVSVHYEMYENIPLLKKWVTVSVNPGLLGSAVVNGVVVEHLGVTRPFAPYPTYDGSPR